MQSVSANAENRFENKDCLFPFIMAALSVPVFIFVFIDVTFINDPLDPFWLYSFILTFPTSLFVLLGILAYKGKISVFANVLLTIILTILSLIFSVFCSFFLMIGADNSMHKNPRQYPRVYQVLSESPHGANTCIKNVFPASIPGYAKDVQFSYSDDFETGTTPVSIKLSFHLPVYGIIKWIHDLDGKENFSRIIGSKSEYKTFSKKGIIIFTLYEVKGSKEKCFVSIDIVNNLIRFVLSRSLY
jgi:hypothetical protein